MDTNYVNEQKRLWEKYSEKYYRRSWKIDILQITSGLEFRENALAIYLHSGQVYFYIGTYTWIDQKNLPKYFSSTIDWIL